MILESKQRQFKPHPAGVFNAVCVDVIDLGLVATQFQGQARLARKLRLIFETDAPGEEDRPRIIGRSFTASLHPKARLAEFLGQWRGQAVTPGEHVDLDQLIGTPCRLDIQHVTLADGRTCGQVRQVAPAQTPLPPSGRYDAVAMRQRLAERRRRQGAANHIPVVQKDAAGPSNVPVVQQPAPAAAATEEEVGF